MSCLSLYINYNFGDNLTKDIQGGIIFVDNLIKDFIGTIYNFRISIHIIYIPVTKIKSPLILGSKIKHEKIYNVGTFFFSKE